MLNEAKMPVKLAETIFDILYLCTAFGLAIFLIFRQCSPASLQWYMGVSALILVLGDACHLIPRIVALWDKNHANHTFSLGIGKMVSSLTMTMFYVGLWHIGTVFYGFHRGTANVLIVCLASIRFGLCLLPQNKWTSSGASNRMALWRNIPFFLLGFAVMVLFLVGSSQKPSGPAHLWVAIFISFAFYIPVVLYSGRNPKIGMLMLPKSCTYIVIILMGFSLPG